MNKRLISNLLLLILGLLIVLLVAIIVSNGVHYDYHYYSDDIGFITTFRNYGIADGTGYLLKHCNGRVLSHLLTLWLMPVVTMHKLPLIGLYLGNALAFIVALAWFLKQFFRYRYLIQLSIGNSLIAACIFYTLFFFFFFAKRFEFWFWLSDVFIYEYSLMLILILSGMLLREDNRSKTGLIIILLSGCIGLMSETQAVVQLLILFFFLFGGKKGWKATIAQGKWKLAGMAMIATGLLINFFAPGTMHKINISKTHVDGVNNFICGIRVLVRDLLLNWDHIKINSFELTPINSVLVQVTCALLMFFLLKLVVQNWLGNKYKQLPTKGFSWVLCGAVMVVLITYLVPAMLYANLLDFVVDRCKLIGCFFMFLALFDLTLILAIFFNRKEEL